MEAITNSGSIDKTVNLVGQPPRRLLKHCYKELTLFKIVRGTHLLCNQTNCKIKHVIFKRVWNKSQGTNNRKKQQVQLLDIWG